MSNTEKNSPKAKRPRIKKSSDLSQTTSLVYKVVNDDVIEIVDGQKHNLSAEQSRNNKNTRKELRKKSIDSTEALRIMQSYGYSIRTPEERRIALDDYKRINKRAAKKGKEPLKKRESSSYASINREQFPKAGSGFKVVPGGVETNRRKH